MSRSIAKPVSITARAERIKASAGDNFAQSPLSRRKQPTQERARATVQSIFKATETLVRKHGFANVGTRMIAEEAGISVGSLYQYFPTYEAILLAWYEDVAATAANRLNLATIGILEKPFDESIRITVTAMLGILEKHSLVVLRLPMEVQAVERATPSTSFLYLNRAAMRIFFARHREFDPQDTERHIFILETVIMGVMRRWVLEKPRTVSRAVLLDQVCGMIEGYLARNATDQVRRS